MRTTITLDDELFERAASITGDHNASSLLSKALEMMISADSRKRLLRLSGNTADFTLPSRDKRAADLGKVAEDDASSNS
ncbi:MAG: type II toxin-antitoxin system VapB family antitoxin [Verrucomicrobiae bacterium]|nr:type II toxin-antitoxin system VapB family antitoxin [Verrucomicrobiae bacterium]NNJ86171.1 type II toxin-antitoxin system VapB family antitoxin [Akkermansiaceae bacterium]